MAIPMFSTGLAAAVFLLSEPAMGHMAQKVPMSRQWAWSRQEGKTIYDIPEFEANPHYWNSGGIGHVIFRGKTEISAATLASLGGHRTFPLIRTPYADNGNMLEPNEVAKRHAICGDPKLAYLWDQTNEIKYSTANKNWEPLTTYAKGQVIEMVLSVQAYHKGHVEFSICDTTGMKGRSVPKQECFNRYPLTRAADDNLNSPIDPDYPGRYYVAPPCVAWETGQGINRNVDFDNGDAYERYDVKVRYTLPPDLECKHCILQMHYFTGHHTKYIGYNEFNPPSWPSQCAPDKQSWNIYNGAREQRYPQEFWNCADITIEDPCVEYGGIHRSNPEGLDTCCSASCGVCDGADCRNQPGGKNNCCPWQIARRDRACSVTKSAPCVLDPCAEFGGVYNYAPEGETCCSASCGECEQADCRNQPGGLGKCCPGRIRGRGDTCSATNGAPCKLAA